MTTNSITSIAGGGVAFTGPDAVRAFQAKAVASALRFYAKTGMKINRAYTPAAMMAKASELTGKVFKGRDYEAAAKALDELAQKKVDKIHQENAQAAAQPTI